MISVCIPVYNMEKTLERTLKSCLNQIPDNDIEYLLLDNNSTDNTYNIASSFLNKIPNFRIIKNETNVGAYGNHNLCVKLARNEWIKFLHGDDELLPNAICILKSFISTANTDFIFFDYIGNRYYDKLSISSLKISTNLARLLIIHGNFIGTPSTTMFRKKSFEEIGLFDLKLNPASDADAFFRLSLKYGGFFINQKIVNIDDDPFDGYKSYEKNRLMFLKNTFIQLDKWKKYNSQVLNSIDWKNVYKNESFRFFDSSIILILRFRFKLIFHLFKYLFLKKVFFTSLYFYITHKFSGKKSSNIRINFWYNDI